MKQYVWHFFIEIFTKQMYKNINACNKVADA